MERGLRYREQRVVCEDGWCMICDERSDCGGGYWVMREHGLHCVGDYVQDVDK